MTRSIQLPDVRKILDGLERRLGILERRIRPQAEAPAAGHTHDGEGANSIVVNGDSTDPLATAAGPDAIALGVNASAPASVSLAIGSFAGASGIGSTAIGDSAFASAQNAIAIGSSSNAQFGSAVGIGDGASANGVNAVALGSSASADYLDGTALGSDAAASGMSATAVGANANAHEDAVAIGYNVSTTDPGQVNFGTRQLAFGGQSITGDGDLLAGQVTPRVNEAADTLEIRAKYADGVTLKTFQIGTAAPVSDHDSLTGVSANDHHNQAHVVDGADHTASGLTSGHVMRATGATTFAFGALQDGDVPATIARDSEVAAAVTAHEAAGDPHTGYATDADLTAHAATPHGGAHPDLATHDTLGLATQAELDAHAAAADPHTGYLRESVISGLAAPTIALGATAAAGVATTAISSDATIDAFDTTAPNVIEPDDAAAVGVVNFAARRDHEHGIVTAVAGASTFADSAAEGTATSFARSDHRHSREADPVTAHVAAADPHTGYLKESVISGLATPAIVLGTAAAAGTGTTPIRHDATIAAFDATSPTTSLVGDAAAVGTAAFAARRDHKHAREAVNTANPPACRVYNSGNLIPANVTWTALTFDSERYDTATMHSTSTNTSRITIGTAGLYLITGNVQWGNNANGERLLAIRLNNTTDIAVVSLFGTAGSTSGLMKQVSTVYKLAVSDYLELRAYQSCGGPLTILATGNFSPEFSAIWIGLG